MTSEEGNIKTMLAPNHMFLSKKLQCFQGSMWRTARYSIHFQMLLGKKNLLGKRGMQK